MRSARYLNRCPGRLEYLKDVQYATGQGPEQLTLIKPAQNHRLVQVGKDLQEHLVQPLT